jgi:hypothetical protein
MSEGSSRFKVAWKKNTSSWVARPEYETSSHEHLKGLTCRALEVVGEGVDMSCHVPSKPLARNIAKFPAPVKAELIAAHKSRFK